MIFKRKAWKLGDNIPTDVITPIAILFKPMSEAVQLVLEAANPDFPKRVQKGDIIVAGRNFACSSGRAIAPKAIEAAGASVAIGESFSRTFYCNAHEVGLPVLLAPGLTQEAAEGDLLQVNVKAGQIQNLTREKNLSGEPYRSSAIELCLQAAAPSLGSESPICKLKICDP